ncbi:hypothetical protein M0812_10170 [Anaeramoeba flamelloides]|uniref:SEC7 domain-containing protein n=1 Tax=Anaeramoeba flamelloides TaxID=1746091 RepID=A0AAV7ZV03_9EUKA|nr:hypothetical protein M0812_10170 [Anaeramoeba flamelloides]
MTERSVLFLLRPLYQKIKKECAEHEKFSLIKLKSQKCLELFKELEMNQYKEKQPISIQLYSPLHLALNGKNTKLIYFSLSILHKLSGSSQFNLQEEFQGISRKQILQKQIIEDLIFQPNQTNKKINLLLIETLLVFTVTPEGLQISGDSLLNVTNKLLILNRQSTNDLVCTTSQVALLQILKTLLVGSEKKYLQQQKKIKQVHSQGFENELTNLLSSTNIQQYNHLLIKNILNKIYLKHENKELEFEEEEPKITEGKEQEKEKGREGRVSEKGKTKEQERVKEKEKEKEKDQKKEQVQKQEKEQEQEQEQKESLKVNQDKQLEIEFDKNDLVLFIKSICRETFKNLPSKESKEFDSQFRSKKLQLNLIEELIDFCSNSELKYSKIITKLIEEKVCFSIVKNGVSPNLDILKISHKLFLKIFENFKPYLKIEISIFLNSMLLDLLESVNVTFLQKKEILKTLLIFLKEPQNLVDIFVNYDCDLEMPNSNIFERMIDLLSKISRRQYKKEMETWITQIENSDLRKLSIRVLIIVIRSMIIWCGNLFEDKKYNSVYGIDLKSYKKMLNEHTSFIFEIDSDLEDLNFNEFSDNYEKNVDQKKDKEKNKNKSKKKEKIKNKSKNKKSNNNNNNNNNNTNDDNIHEYNISRKEKEKEKEKKYKNKHKHKQRQRKNQKQRKDKESNNLNKEFSLPNLNRISEHHANKISSRAKGFENLKLNSNSPILVVKRKELKIVLEKGYELFNRNPNKGIGYLIEMGQLKNNIEEITNFLKNTQELSKKKIGEFLGKYHKLNIQVLHHWVDQLEFTNLDFYPAICQFLSGFRLPGESQQIDRIMEKFAQKYYLNNPHKFNSANTAYILAYSVIMLHTDAHNPQIKNKMTQEEFIINNRGIDSGKDLPKILLSKLYENVVNNEIKLKEENDEERRMGGAGRKKFLHQQKRYNNTNNYNKSNSNNTNSVNNNFRIYDVDKLLTPKQKYLLFEEESRRIVEKSQKLIKQENQKKKTNEKKLFSTSYHILHVKYMFNVSWMAFLSSFSTIMNETEHMKTIKYCLFGFRNAIKVAGIFYLELQRDAFVTTLTKFTLLSNIEEMKTKNIDSIKTLIKIAKKDGNYLGNSWNEILKCISQLENFKIITDGHQQKTNLMYELKNVNNTVGKSNSSSYVNDNDGTDSDGDNLMLGGLMNNESNTAATTNEKENKNLQNISININFSSIEKIFTNSVKLNNEAIVYFINNLILVSKKEINSLPKPRLFSLKKLMEVVNYNTFRIKIIWIKIWLITSKYLNEMGCHQNETVSLTSINSLRHLVIQFLKKEELENFQFQKNIFSPFLKIIKKQKNEKVKLYALQSVDQIVQYSFKNIKSGWIMIFSILLQCSKMDRYNINLLKTSFNLVSQYHNSYFNYFYKEFLFYINTLFGFAENDYDIQISKESLILINIASNWLFKNKNILNQYSNKLQNINSQSQLAFKNENKNGDNDDDDENDDDDDDGEENGNDNETSGGGGSRSGSGSGNEKSESESELESEDRSESTIRSNSKSKSKLELKIDEKAINDNDFIYKYWFPIFTGLLKLSTITKFNEIKLLSIQTLINLFKLNKMIFKTDVWEIIFKTIIIPIFDEIFLYNGNGNYNDNDNENENKNDNEKYKGNENENDNDNNDSNNLNKGKFYNENLDFVLIFFDKLVEFFIIEFETISFLFKYLLNLIEKILLNSTFHFEKKIIFNLNNLIIKCKSKFNKNIVAQLSSFIINLTDKILINNSLINIDYNNDDDENKDKDEDFGDFLNSSNQINYKFDIQLQILKLVKIYFNLFINELSFQDINTVLKKIEQFSIFSLNFNLKLCNFLVENNKTVIELPKLLELEFKTKNFLIHYYFKFFYFFNNRNVVENNDNDNDGDSNYYLMQLLKLINHFFSKQTQKKIITKNVFKTNSLLLQYLEIEKKIRNEHNSKLYLNILDRILKLQDNTLKKMLENGLYTQISNLLTFSNLNIEEKLFLLFSKIGKLYQIEK